MGAREGHGCACLRPPAPRPMGLPGRMSPLLTPGDAEKKQLVELHKSRLFLFQGLKIDYGSCGSIQVCCLQSHCSVPFPRLPVCINGDPMLGPKPCSSGLSLGHPFCTFKVPSPPGVGYPLHPRHSRHFGNEDGLSCHLVQCSWLMAGSRALSCLGTCTGSHTDPITVWGSGSDDSGR